MLLHLITYLTRVEQFHLCTSTPGWSTLHFYLHTGLYTFLSYISIGVYRENHPCGLPINITVITSSGC